MEEKNRSMQQRWDDSYLDGGNAQYLEQLYQQYLDDPNSVPEQYLDYFSNLTPEPNEETDHFAIRDRFKQNIGASASAGSACAGVSSSPEALLKAEQQAQVYRLINAYRTYGHNHAKLDPLEIQIPKRHEGLDLSHFNLVGAQEQEFSVGDFVGLTGRHRLKDIIQALEKTYCQHVGFEFKHITNFKEVEWLRNNIEKNLATPELTQREKEYLLKDLSAAANLEKYLGRKYVGQKRFSLEGGESLIPLLHEVIFSCPQYGIKEVILGMAHRGRLNVLVNVLGKKPIDLFNEFEGKIIDQEHSGDVKYHMGFSSNIKVKGQPVHLSLAFNPSHLEIATPVVAGLTRAKQRRRNDDHYNEVLPITLHGDAAFAGQGVVMETLAMSQVRGFKVGGTIRVVINNQVGFTTSKPEDARSSQYCSDIAKMIQAPIFHVNADDPEAVIFVTKLAMAYRNKFHKDVVIDMVCFRRHGHNESDEPSGTQPLMYKKIKQHRSIHELYAEKLVSENSIPADLPAKLAADYQKALDNGDAVSHASDDISDYEFAVNWKPYLGRTWRVPAKTTISKKKLEQYGKALSDLPEGFVLQAQVKKIINNRLSMSQGKLPIDWGFAESLAYASLVDEGFPIRISGEDCGRGTFAHRHAVLHDQNTGEIYVPLQHIGKDQASIIVIDSLLSEEAVLAFEYGFASVEPGNLAIWEAQFGDFANCAQVVVDQFLSSGEQKWGRLCGLVMLLPHGYEGMGPEHSSARLERYLQLCAQDNMQVCVPSTPAQIFHLLRRQMIRECRIPLIVISPKSLLRHKLAVSTVDDFTKGEFQLLIPEIDKISAKKAKRLVLCSGKVYYDLLEKRREEKIDDIAIVRLEQLYPFPKEEITTLFAEYENAKDVIWCQEEPRNQGVWYKVRPRINECLQESQVLNYVGRPESAAPAVGVHLIHVKEQKQLVNEALKLETK